MHVKEKHYEKVGEDFEQVHESYRRSFMDRIGWSEKRLPHFVYRIQININIITVI